MPRSSPMQTPRYELSQSYFDRAKQVIPGGTHLSGRALVDVDTSPMYFDRGAGCRLWDVAGHEYIDYLMAYGAFLIGYAHPEVELAAFEQAQRGRLLSLNHPAHIAFVETLLALFPGTEMGVFFRAGSEATTAALRVARRYTQRRRVARCGYHGWHDWCLPLEDFVPAGLAEQVLEFRASDPETLRAILQRYSGEVAAVIVAPEMVLPFDPAVFHTLRNMSREHGAVFIMDEVKTGLRIAPNSVSERVGLVPDLITVSKALGNGFPIAALLGTREVMQAGAGMHYSATFHGDTAAMAAAGKVLQLINDHDVQGHVFRLGQALIDGLNSLARTLGLPLRAMGEPLAPMPFLRFEHDNADLNARLSESFYRAMLAGGVLLHPRHMWFISLAHTAGDIAHTLDVAERAMREARLLT